MNLTVNMYSSGDSEPQSFTAPRNAAKAVPGLADAFRKYGEAYWAVRPALRAPGGMAATLRAAPQLAANLDAWMRDVGAALLIPVRAHLCRVSCREHRA
jgi:hypothetical protein